ncbi:MAG: 3-deoxy-7-phosphoheptulonate synthase [Myxococcota bacterium]
MTDAVTQRKTLEKRTMLVKYSKGCHTGSVVHVGAATFGPGTFSVIAGPCAVENLQQLLQTATAVQAAGACCLRAGAYKPRTSPYSFQGLGEEGLRMLKTVAKQTQLPAVTEVMDAAQIDAVRQHAQAFQVGSRNMHNFSLLQALSRERLPVILKRGMSARIDEWLLAAEYIVKGGNPNVILCERGIRTFEVCLRNTLDLSAVAYLKQRTHLPVIVDPSHATGMSELVIPLAKAALACGADGLMVEVHPCPSQALCDGRQSLSPHAFEQLMKQLRALAAACGKKMHAVQPLRDQPKTCATKCQSPPRQSENRLR